MGFASGLPLLLIGGTLKLWLARAQVDISTIGYFTWVGMAYSLKFLWAPLLDRYTLFGIGRRRSWMMAMQIALIAGLFVMGLLDPKESLLVMAGLAVVIGVFSATQDMAIDSYRREICTDLELGLASTMTQYGYRVAMLVAGGVAVGFVNPDTGFTWGHLYFAMAACMCVGLVTTSIAPEPVVHESAIPKTLASAVVGPFKEFLARDGAISVLAFVFLYKFGDALGGALLSPFYVQMGYSNVDIALIAKTVGLTATLFGLFFGGLIIIRLGIYRSLWFFGILQALSTAGFALITYTGPEKWALSFAVVFEDISQGMGSVAFVAFIASVCDRRYTATQYAILSSIAMLGRTFFSGFTGDIQKNLGWANYFYLCGAIGLLGLVMLVKMKKYSEPRPTVAA